MPHRTKGGLRPTHQPKDHAFFRIPQEADPKILNVLIQMKKDNKSDYTINFTRKALSLIEHNCNMQDPEQVKTFIAKKTDTLKTART